MFIKVAKSQFETASIQDLIERAKGVTECYLQYINDDYVEDNGCSFYEGEGLYNLHNEERIFDPKKDTQFYIDGILYSLKVND
jgi:hypothetical protein